MNYYGPHQLAQSMHAVRSHTITIAEDIPEESYDYRPGSTARNAPTSPSNMARSRWNALERRAG